MGLLVTLCVILFVSSVNCVLNEYNTVLSSGDEILLGTSVLGFRPFVGYSDLFLSYSEFPRELLVFKRGGDGFYSMVGSRNSSLQYAATVSTNGEWASIANPDAHQLFKMNADGALAEQVRVFDFDTSVSRITSDGSFVAVLAASIVTYEFNNNNEWVLTRNDTFENITFPSIKRPFGIRLEDSYMASGVLPSNVGVDGFFPVHLFSRQPDKSWMFMGTAYLKNAYARSFMNLLLVDNNTLIVTTLYLNEYPAGAVHIFKKSNGEWIETNEFHASAYNVTGRGYFGINIHQLHENSILVAAPWDGYDSEDNASGLNTGSIFMLQRNASGDWDITGRIVPEKPRGFAAVGLASNDYDILSFDGYINVTSTYSCLVHTLPVCNNKSIDITCNYQQRSSCTIPELDLSDLAFIVSMLVI